MRVLFIEDDNATARSVELMLKCESFTVLTADLGDAGVEAAKRDDYDVILLDLNLPDMSGFEVLRRLRISNLNTPILILSGLAGLEDKVKGLGLGADDYMTKPFHRDELVARIQKILDVFICKLRKKLSDASGGKDYIETVWGRGYVLREPSDDHIAVGL